MEIRGAVPTAGLTDGVVTVEDGVVASVAAADAPGSSVAPGTVILPGLLDIHCHGGGGHSFATTDPAEALAAAAYHAAAGTTGVIASLVTAAPEELLRQVRTLAPLVAAGQLLGIHLEGPFLAPARRGAHAPWLLRDPDPALVADLLEAAGGAIKIVTVAPERPGAAPVAAMLRAAGVVVAYGHTDAGYDCMARALAGASGDGLVTHLGNAMPALHHRAAGPVAAALAAAADDDGERRADRRRRARGRGVHPAGVRRRGAGTGGARHRRDGGGGHGGRRLRARAAAGDRLRWRGAADGRG